MWQFGLALFGLSIGAAVLVRDRCFFGVCAALLANWVGNTAYVELTHDVAPWGVFLASDYATGIFVIAGLGLICGRFTIGSIVIALSYGVECVVHASYGLSDQGPWPAYRYWWALYIIALAQLLFTTGWGAYELARRHIGAGGSLSSNLSGTRGALETSATPED